MTNEGKIKAAKLRIARAEQALSRVLSHGEQRDLLMDNFDWTSDQVAAIVTDINTPMARRLRSYPNLHRLLGKAGHSPRKSAEIILDAKRGDDHAMRWILLLWRARNGYDDAQANNSATNERGAVT